MGPTRSCGEKAESEKDKGKRGEKEVNENGTD